MTKEEMLAIGEKIKNQTATPEEVLVFTKEFSKMIGEIKEELV